MESQLQTFLATIIDSGEADQMRGDFARRIVTTIFALREYAGDAKLHHLPGQLRRNAALEIDESTLTVGELFADIYRVHPKQTGKLLDLAGIDADIGRAGPDGFHRCTDGKRLAIAVGNHASMRR